MDLIWSVKKSSLPKIFLKFYIEKYKWNVFPGFLFVICWSIEEKQKFIVSYINFSQYASTAQLFHCTLFNSILLLVPSHNPHPFQLGRDLTLRFSKNSIWFEILSTPQAFFLTRSWISLPVQLLGWVLLGTNL